MNKDKNNTNKGKSPISSEQLLAHLNDNLAKNIHKDLPKEMNDDAFFADAIEGLSGIKDNEAISNQIALLNTQLNSMLKDRNIKKKKRKLPTNRWTIIAIALTIGLACIGYLVIFLNSK